MLTIGQLASYTGVTVRAIRHYHQRGLLAEPDRDASGYRRYDGRAVVELIRIKTLAEAGVPLARISELLGAEPAEFAGAITQIDQALKKKIRELTQHRHKIAELTGGERLFLPPEHRGDPRPTSAPWASASGRVQIERDGWILVAALSPELVPEWVSTKRAALDDPEFRRIYVLGDQALDWDPADPRIAELADAMADWAAHSRPDTSPRRNVRQPGRRRPDGLADRRLLAVLGTAERALPANGSRGPARPAGAPGRPGPSISAGPGWCSGRCGPARSTRNGRPCWMPTRWPSPGRSMSRVSAPGCGSRAAWPMASLIWPSTWTAC